MCFLYKTLLKVNVQKARSKDQTHVFPLLFSTQILFVNTRLVPEINFFKEIPTPLIQQKSFQNVHFYFANESQTYQQETVY